MNRMRLVAIVTILGAAGCGTVTDSQQGAAHGASPKAPHFERTLLLETTAETSANASIGDVNGDGNPDIVLAKGRH
jgi:hypothetical protein